MTIINKSITLLGASTKAVSFTVYVQADNSYTVTATGIATDGAGFNDQIAATKNYPAGTNVLDNMAAAALTELRKQNGLET